MRILVVDDDFVSREKLKAILAPYGDVESAEDGEAAVRMFEAARLRLSVRPSTMRLTPPGPKPS